MGMLDDLMKNIPEPAASPADDDKPDEPDHAGEGKTMFGYGDEFKAQYGERKK